MEHRVKQEEVYFTIGEAITLAAVAWQSTAATDPIASLDDRGNKRLFACIGLTVR